MSVKYHVLFGTVNVWPKSSIFIREGKVDEILALPLSYDRNDYTLSREERIAIMQTNRKRGWHKDRNGDWYHDSWGKMRNKLKCFTNKPVGTTDLKIHERVFLSVPVYMTRTGRFYCYDDEMVRYYVDADKVNFEE